VPSRREHFEALVARQPGNELFRFSLAQALMAEGQAEEALVHFQTCAEGKADWMMPRILLGKALLGLARKAEARPWLESALRLAVDQHHEEPEQELRALLADFRA
jgi:predicted Zn-dependent protease